MSTRRLSRPLAYPLRIFGSYLGELIEARNESQGTLEQRMGLARGVLSSYRTGRHLPVDRAAFQVIAEVLAPTKRARPAVRREFVRRWLADLMYAHVRATGMTAAEARRAVEDAATQGPR